MNQTSRFKPVPFERLASAWLGVLTKEYPESRYADANLDRMINVAIGRMTLNISPTAIAMAYFDWLIHLSLSPSKQQKLAQKALQQGLRWQTYAVGATKSDGAEQPHCIVPLPQDKRFNDPAWRALPFNVMSQGFLLTQQWWHRATTGVHGVSHHHEDVVTFTVRQILDTLSPSNFLLTNPVVLRETRNSHGANLLRGAGNVFADGERYLTGGNPRALDAFQVGQNIAVSPGKIVFRNRLIELIQYEANSRTVHVTPVLFVPAWIMKYYILDLSPQNSLVKYLVDHGYTVFMISWKNPQAEDRDLSMEDYRTLGVMAAIDTISALTHAPQINAAGYCLGGTLLSIAAAAMARDDDLRLSSVTLFATQVDFKEPGELSIFIDESQVSFLEAIMWEQGYLDTRQMAGAFQLLRSNDLIWSRRLNQYLLGLSETGTDMMAWNADATRMPYRMHTEYLHDLFLHNNLAEGRYRAGGRPIALTDIRVPIFAVGTLTDHVAPWRSVFKIQLLTDTEVTFLLTSGGHNAGVVSPPGHPRRSYQIAVQSHQNTYVDAESWQATASHHEGSWWPAWLAWIEERSGESISARITPSALCDAPGTYVLQQ
jgi:polyhydroxyalkanoate synthase